MLKRLVPLEAAADTFTNLPHGLSLVGMPRPDFRKPSKNARRYWYWETFEKWLIEPEEQEINLQDMGNDGPAGKVGITSA